VTKWGVEVSMREELKKSYLPMSESAYYILLSLKNPRHGYGIILYVKEITQNRITLGAGTIYGTLTKFEKDKLIVSAGEEDRRKLYKHTDDGVWLLEQELKRIDELFKNGHSILEG
jgi:DNA-binding PadR family transcriptional regulator